MVRKGSRPHLAVCTNSINDEVEYYENDDKEDVMNIFLEYSVNKQKTSWIMMHRRYCELWCTEDTVNESAEDVVNKDKEDVV